MESSTPAKNIQPKSCIIIGGGICGLVAGTVLQRHGIHVTILDKGRGIGGRLATRRISHPLYGEGVCDYGAQFFTVSDPRCQLWVDEWLQQGVIGEWSRQLTETEQPAYRGLKSNRSIAQHLAKDLTVHPQTLAVKLAWEADNWTVLAENGIEFQGDTAIVTAPIPQTLTLIDRSAIELSSELRHRLEAVIYQPCIAVLALLDRPSSIPEPGGLRLKDPSLAWIACNQKKGISPQATAITLHATPEFSQTDWELDNSVIAAKLIDLAAPWLGATVVEYQVQRWLYSQPQTCYGASYLALQKPGLLVMAGDAFASTHPQEPSLHLETAVLSGLAAANYLHGETAVLTH
jgi:renalase